MLIDEDVDLDKKPVSGGGVEISDRSRTPFRSPWIIPSPCIYSNPRVTPSSCQKQFHQWQVRPVVRVKPYELEPVSIPVCLDELVDVPIDHPF